MGRQVGGGGLCTEPTVGPIWSGNTRFGPMVSCSCPALPT